MSTCCAITQYGTICGRNADNGTKKRYCNIHWIESPSYYLEVSETCLPHLRDTFLRKASQAQATEDLFMEQSD